MWGGADRRDIQRSFVLSSAQFSSARLFLVAKFRQAVVVSKNRAKLSIWTAQFFLNES